MRSEIVSENPQASAHEILKLRVNLDKYTEYIRNFSMKKLKVLQRIAVRFVELVSNASVFFDDGNSKGTIP